MSSKAGLRSKKSGKSLRARRKVDYKKMHLGKTTDGSASTSTERDIGPSSDSDVSLQGASASGNTSYKAPPTFTQSFQRNGWRTRFRMMRSITTNR